MKHNDFHKQGFTLVELSIVLVIIGLLAGGIVAGQSLIHAARLQDVTVQQDAFSKAFNQFKEQYQSIPGDMFNATDYWGSANPSDSSIPSCLSHQTQASPATCNGTGNGFLEFHTASRPYYEILLGWKHLSNAGLIKGAFSGHGEGSFTRVVRDTNVPAGEFAGSSWVMAYLPTIGTSALHPASTDFFPNQILDFHAVRLQNSAGTGVLSASDVWKIDSKTDDGLPASGKIVSVNDSSSASATRCTNPASGSAPAQYAVETGELCTVWLAVD